MSFKLPLLIAVSVVSLLPMHAKAQSTNDVFNRLNRLETEIDTLSRALYRGERPPPSAGGGVNNAQVEVRLQQLESEIRALTGRIEEDAYKIRQLEGVVERLSGDLNMRLQDLERGGSGRSGGAASQFHTQQAAPGVPSPSARGGMGYTTLGNQGAAASQDYQYSSGVSGAVPPAVKTAEGFSTQSLGSVAQAGSANVDDAASSYENAFSLLKAANYDASEKAFGDFLNRFPQHVLAGNAKYWLGETYYVRGDYEQAARVFAEGYQQYPQGSKAADNLLKLGLSLGAVGNNNDACVALRQLKQDFPKGAGPVLRRAEQEMSKLGC